MKKIYLVLLTAFIFFAGRTQTVTLNAVLSGKVTSLDAKTNGDLTNICSSCDRGYVKYDLSSIPAGAIISAVSMKITAITGSLSSASTANKVTTTSLDAATATTGFYNATNSANTAWTGSWSFTVLPTTFTLPFTATGVSDIQNRLSSGNVTYGVIRGSTNVYNFAGYNNGTTANQPQLVITYSVPSPAIVYTPLTNTCTPGDRILTASITSPNGVPTSGIGLPVLYYKINGGTNISVQGVSIGSNQYTFTFGAAAGPGDQLSYYIVAQDGAVTPGVQSNPSAGAAGLTPNPPAAATPPTNPNTFYYGATLSGTYNIGTAGAYPTLTAAINAYNNACALVGPVTFLLADATYPSETFPIDIKSSAFASATNTLTIKPATGVSPTITGTNASTILKISGGDFITINGSNSGGTTRDLTIENTNAAGGAVVCWIASTTTDGALNNSILNTNLKGVSGTASIADILVSGSVFGAASEVPNNNLIITNNFLTRAQNAIFAIGNATTPDQNWNISNNIMGSALVADKMGFRGMAVQNAANFTITNNTIRGIATTSTSAGAGILVGAVLNGGTISKNRVSDIKNTGAGAIGIYVNTSSTSQINIINNFVSDITGLVSTTVATTLNNGYGIFLNGGSGFKIYNNSVNLNTNQSAAGLPAALNVAAGVTLAGAIDLRNNIFVNSQTIAGERYAIYSAAANTVFSNIDYNNYATTGANLGFIGVNRADLTAVQAGFGGNTNAKNIMPVFTATDDLHLVPTAVANGGLNNVGLTLAAVTDDIDGDPRSATPDLGADEFTYIPPACPGAGSVAINSIQGNSANVTWVGTGTFIVEYGPTGFTPGTGLAAGSGSSLVIAPTTSPTSLTGLNPGIGYQVYVRQDCTGSGNGFSTNAGPVAFTTTLNCTSNISPANGATGVTSPVTLTWNAAPTATSYDVYLSTTNPPTTVIATSVAATTYSWTGALGNTLYYWYVSPKNASGSAGGCATANTTSFTTVPIACTPTYTTPPCVAGGGDSLSVFRLVGETVTLDNNSGAYCGDAGTPGYSQYLALPQADMAAGKAYAGSMRMNPNYSEFVSIWIDFNNDLNFANTERVLTGILMAPGTTAFSIYIPAGSATGVHRMRVRLNEAAATIDPCANITYGETEDYLVNIISGPGAAYNVSTTGAGACTNIAATTVNAATNNNTVAVPILDAAGKIVASVNANGNDLGTITSSLYRNTGAVRQNGTGGQRYLDRNITITPGTQPVSGNVAVRFYFTAAELTALQAVDPTVTGPGSLNVTKVSAGCSAAFTGPGTSLPQTSSGSQGPDYFIEVNTPAFSTFFIAGGNVVLPVSVEFFRGSKLAGTHYLDWKVNCTSAPSVTLVLERSADGRNFRSIDEQNASATRCLQGFNYTDRAPLAGINYYRLKIITPDGAFRYSTIVALLNKDKGFEFVSLAPNPVLSTSVLTLTTVKGGKMDIEVTDITGKLVMKQTVVVIAGNNILNMNFAALGSGIYNISAVNTDAEIKTIRFIKL